MQTLSHQPTIIIIAAGKGTRMRSNLPKVLHPIGGKPMLAHVLDAARQLNPAKIATVIGHGAETIRERITDTDIHWVLQTEQLGTGHAVMQAEEDIGEDVVLILCGDVPLIRAETLATLLEQASGGFSLLTTILDNPDGYGRIVRDAKGAVAKIVEHKDATVAELALTEVNTGIMAVKGRLLRDYLSRLDNNNAQKEYYLTDIVEMAVREQVAVQAVICDEPQESMGINDRAQQASMERFYQQRQVNVLMEQGVSFADPYRVDIRGTVTAGNDVFVDVNAVFEGVVSLGDNVQIGSNCVIQNSTIGAGSVILPNSVIEQSTVGADCRVGPFARLRPETVLHGQNHVGNFVEIKKSTIGMGSKVNHLTYIGDTIMGAHCNIGAGTITCNYDGAYKHQTHIGNNVFVGSDTQLVAPVRVGDNMTIGAGTTVTLNSQVDGGNEEALIISRTRQRVLQGWKRPKKATE
jgi:bifunctional UDP-N-acetylglucosamine pyrophosphorylase / glucosamine-1-phosphate N-acetyltransferase